MKKFLTILATVLACIFITACTPSNVENAKAKMEEAGYTVLAYSGDDDAEGLIGGLIAKNGILTGENVTALFFDTKDNAKKFYDDHASESNATLDGKWVYWGTEAAIKAFKK